MTKIFTELTEKTRIAIKEMENFLDNELETRDLEEEEKKALEQNLREHLKTMKKMIGEEDNE